MRQLAHIFLTALLVMLFSSFSTFHVLAERSDSDNFSIEGSFGIFGGEKSSDNYTVTDTGGGFAPGFFNSTNYITCSGFQCTLSQVPSITFSLSSTSINLGTLTTGSVNTASHTATVTTNFQGYSVTVVEDGNLRRSGGADIDDVGDGAISAGSEEYGLATSKSGQDITQDTDCSSSTYSASAITTSSQSVASAIGPTATSGDITTLCYAASRAGLTTAGSYQHTLTYIATGSF